jgi:pimeloyl-ACP methyl ester carboxylesterase
MRPRNLLRLVCTIAAICVSLYKAQAEPIVYKHAIVGGVNLFYREAGDKNKPTILLLHGFPSSSFEFRDLIPVLAHQFHVLAPDYPGMGNSEAPPASVLQPTFDNISLEIEGLVQQLGEKRLILYMHDFGGPVGMRIAQRHPGWIAGLVFQNTSVSLDGYNPARLKVYQEIGGEETPEKLQKAEQAATEERDIFLHTTGAHDSNISLYRQWNTYLKSNHPKTLVVWGKNDPVFTTAAAESVKSAMPETIVHYYDAGHFALDENSDDIGRRIVEVFAH